MPWLTCCRKVRDRGQLPASSWLPGDYAVDLGFATQLPRVRDRPESIVAAGRRIGTPGSALPPKGNRLLVPQPTGRAKPRMAQIPRAPGANAASRLSA